MKKITVCYHISFEVDVPDEDFYKAMEKEGRDRGSAFNAIASNTKQWKGMFTNDVDGEIIGVYNRCYFNDNHKLMWAQPEDDEIYWEA